MSSNDTSNELTKFDEAPKSAADGSVPLPRNQRNNSVFDFLYDDHRRIASFLAQFETYGVLQQVKATESVSHKGTSETSTKAGIDVVTLVKGDIARGDTVSDEERNSPKRHTIRFGETLALF